MRIIHLGFIFTLFISACTKMTGMDKMQSEPLPQSWPGGAKAAIALTYDDSLISQINNALPALKAHEFKATFYLTLDTPGYSDHLEIWRRAAKSGHELGNHTVSHPCQASLSGREWVTKDKDLDLYSLDRIVAEIKAVNKALNRLDGLTERSYAYTCGDFLAGGVDYTDSIRSLVSGARTVNDDPQGLLKEKFDLMRIPSLAVNETSAKSMIAYVDRLISQSTLGTITFHGIGGDHLSVSHEDHKALLDYLNENRDLIYVDSVQNLLEIIREQASRADSLH